MIKLSETAKLMNSEDYKGRFLAEYFQLKIRAEKLELFINRVNVANSKNQTQPDHDCPIYVLEEQLRSMYDYLRVLKLRAVYEDIDIDECNYCFCMEYCKNKECCNENKITK